VTPADELVVRQLCRRLYRLGERALEEFILMLVRCLSGRAPFVDRLREWVERLEAAGGRCTLDALGANNPIRPPLHLVRGR
jgi:hypothetical protein